MILDHMNPQQRLLAEKIIQQCALSRVWFAKNVLGMTPEPWQEEEWAALDSGVLKISIRSGHGVGKTCFCAITALHFLLFRDEVKIIVTAPASKQLEDGLIPEMHKWIKKLPTWMSSQLVTTTERMTRQPNTENNFVSFRTARKENPEALAGVHADNVMIIVDEASGVHEVIYETGSGTLSTEGAIAILIGNPTRPSGFFWKTHNTLKHVWRTRKVSCLDSSRVSEEYIKTQRAMWGVNSREYAVRVLGEFPSTGADQLIPRDYVESAVGRDIGLDKSYIYWGVDPGRGGDPTGFVERCANAVLGIEELRYSDLMNVVGWVKQRWDSTIPSRRPDYVFIDVIGLGYGVYDRLKELELPVIPVNVSETGGVSEQYYRLRDELWFKSRAWFESRVVRLPSAEEQPLVQQLVEELVAMEQKPPMSNGKVAVKSKEDMKSEGIPSPNLADALNLTFARDNMGQMGMVKPFFSKYKAKQAARRIPGLA